MFVLQFVAYCTDMLLIVSIQLFAAVNIKNILIIVRSSSVRCILIIQVSSVVMLLLPWKPNRWYSTHIKLFKHNQSMCFVNNHSSRAYFDEVMLPCYGSGFI